MPLKVLSYLFMQSATSLLITCIALTSDIWSPCAGCDPGTMGRIKTQKFDEWRLDLLLLHGTGIFGDQEILLRSRTALRDQIMMLHSSTGYRLSQLKTPESILDITDSLRDELGFDESEEEIEVVWALYHEAGFCASNCWPVEMKPKAEFRLKTSIDRNT